MLNPRNEAKIDDKIIRRLVKISWAEEKKLCLYDFKYLYCIINTQKLSAKKGLFTDLIFAKNIEITIEKYKRKIEMLFKNQAEFLKNDDFLPSKAELISKDHFIKKLNHYDNYFDKFYFFSPIKSHSDKGIEILLNQGIRSFCKCISINIKDPYYQNGSNCKNVLENLNKEI